MFAKWKDGYDPQIAIDRLEKIKTINAEGRAQFNTPEWEDSVAVLESALSLSSEFPESIRSQMVVQAVFEAARKPKLLPKSILNEITKKEREYRKRTVSRYFLATSMSMQYSAHLKNTRVNGCIVGFHRTIPKRFKRDDHLQIAQSGTLGEMPHNYVTVIIKTFGRSEEEAGYYALDSIDFLRGVWNLYFNRASFWRMSTGPVVPVNEIILGPLHFLHHANGTFVDRTWWYERNYMGPVRPKDMSRDWTNMKLYEKRVRARLEKSSFRGFVEDALRRYARALDGRDYEAAFLKLWSLLEHLTLTRGDNYRITIRRAAFLWADWPFHMQILQHLRDNRNAAVHADKFGNRGETLVYQLKRYVEHLLEFYIFAGKKYPTFDVLKEFLDLPADPAILRKRKLIAQRGIRFLTPKP